jgi:hypothetical protein
MSWFMMSTENETKTAEASLTVAFANIFDVAVAVVSAVAFAAAFAC